MKFQSSQKGAVLIIGLIVLTIVTIAVVASMESSITNERLAANYQFNEILFQAVDSGHKPAIRRHDWINGAIGRNEPTGPYNINIGEKILNIEVMLSHKEVPMPGFSLRDGNAKLHIIEVSSTGISQEIEKTITVGYANLGAG